jgi:hypothetical protein
MSLCIFGGTQLVIYCSMKKILCTFGLLLVSLIGYSQKGISYQAIILDPQKIEIPGEEITDQPLLNGEVWMKFSIYSNSVLQFEEVQKTKTDNYGLINLLIGSTATASFNSLVWDNTQKSLQVFASFDQGASYTKISEQKLTYSPYSLFSETAGKLGGILDISSGGTGATSLAAAKVNLGLDKVNNTSDAAKPISSATLVALNLKASTNDLNAALALKANKAEVGDVTSSLNLKANAADVTSALELKANASDVTSALELKANAADVTSGLALKLNALQVGEANGVASLNAVGIIPSSQLPPLTLSSTSVVGSNAEMIALSNATVGSIAIRTDANKNYVLSALPASTLANWVELLTPAAPVQTVNGYIGSVNITKTDVDLGSVDNTSDANKPVSNPTQTALNLKLDANKVGVASGVASLNALGKVPTDQIPAISFLSVKVLNSQTEMLALSNAVVGSVVIRTDINKNYVLSAANPAVLANWIELLTPAPPVQTVNGYTGSITLAKADVGLGDAENTSDANKPISAATQTALNLKANTADVSTALALKANLAALVLKADATDVTTALDLKANSADVATSLALKANTADLALKANAADVTTALASKVNAASLAAVASSGDFNDLTNIPTSTAASSLSGTVAVINGGTGLTSLGSAGQILTTSNSGTLTWTDATSVTVGTISSTSASSGASITNGILRLTPADATNGGVVSTGTQTFAGSKTFSNTANFLTDISINGVKVGKGTGNVSTNAVVGSDGLISNTTGGLNTAVGNAALQNNTVGSQNSAVGFAALSSNSTSSYNTAIGSASLRNSTGAFNTAIGFNSGNRNTSGTSNTSIGINALYTNTTGTNNTAIGAGADVATASLTNATAIGYGANVATSNTIQLGNANVTNVQTNGSLTAGAVTYPSAHGTSGQVLSTTGSGTLTWTTASAGGDGVPYTGATGAVNLGGYDLTVNGLTVGTGKVNGLSTHNTIVGGAGANRTFTSVSSNTAIGYNTLSSSTPGNSNTVVGAWSLVSNTGAENSAVGSAALERNLGGNENTAVGYYAMQNNLSGSGNTALGYKAGFSSDNTTINNATAIGYQAKVATSNTIQLGADGTNGTTAITNVKTSGTLTAGTVTYPNAHRSTAGDILTINSSGTASWVAASSSSGVPYSGATQAVNLGNYDLTVNGLTIGTGKVAGVGTLNTIVGEYALNRTTSTLRGTDNTAIGHKSMGNETASATSAGTKNTALGSWTLQTNSGQENSAVGVGAMQQNSSGSQNTGIGNMALNINSTGSNNTALGYAADVSANNLSNATAIGNGAKVAASNTIQLGNTDVTNVKTSGSITAGAVTYPKTDGTNGQVLTTNGAGTLAWAAASSSSGVPYSGATQAVNLGNYDLTVNGMTIGTGKVAGAGTLNTIVGEFALNRTTSTLRGTDNTAIGHKSMGNETASATSAGTKNTALGSWTLQTNSGQENSAVGVGAMQQNSSGSQNTGIGNMALNINSTGSNNTALGYAADVSANNLSNATAIGNGAKVAASNTIQLGNTSVTDVKTSGTITAGTVTYPKIHGSTNQVLSTTGSGTLTWTTPSATSAHYIGEAYGGGIVFYVYDGGMHGLITASIDQNAGAGIRWHGGTNTNTRARGDGVGAGLKNTAIIIANQGAVDGNAFAATVCNEYSVTANGVTYGDWYLPSKHEIYLLSLQRTVIGGFAGAYYWSSTEGNNTDAYFQSFFSPEVKTYAKSYEAKVRAIRAF